MFTLKPYQQWAWAVSLPVTGLIQLFGWFSNYMRKPNSLDDPFIPWLNSVIASLCLLGSGSLTLAALPEGYPPTLNEIEMTGFPSFGELAWTDPGEGYFQWTAGDPGSNEYATVYLNEDDSLYHFLAVTDGGNEYQNFTVDFDYGTGVVSNFVLFDGWPLDLEWGPPVQGSGGGQNDDGLTVPEVSGAANFLIGVTCAGLLLRVRSRISLLSLSRSGLSVNTGR